VVGPTIILFLRCGLKLLKCGLVMADWRWLPETAGAHTRMCRRIWGIRIGQLLRTVTLPTGETAICSPHPPHPILLFLSYFCPIELSYLTSSVSQQLNRNHATTTTARPFFLRLLRSYPSSLNIYFQRRSYTYIQSLVDNFV
jgi:hypothetical protein